MPRLEKGVRLMKLAGKQLDIILMQYHTSVCDSKIDIEGIEIISQSLCSVLL